MFQIFQKKILNISKKLTNISKKIYKIFQIISKKCKQNNSNKRR